ncbi:hypothetical protein DFH07DRAFT_964362 [Mycena maculata]|uniref:Uncharacterized protein n=1 Tax=Mycena maculata TaxID=230809 RepID=A0AAD7IIC9_9AGAR|nr:hypothetical protein DFH07DRAFT_964362 [Mycena maculata]
MPVVVGDDEQTFLLRWNSPLGPNDLQSNNTTCSSRRSGRNDGRPAHRTDSFSVGAIAKVTYVSKVWEETFARQIDEPTDITGIAFNTSTNRLILCSSGGKVQAWGCLKNESGRAHLTRVFSRDIDNLAPRAIAFAAFDSGKDKDVLVFGQNDIGPIYKLRGKSGETLEEWSVGGPIGDARVDWNLGLFLVDDIFAGPSLWRYVDYTRVRTYPIRSTRDYYRVRNVRFGEGSTIITGERLEKLNIGTPEWVQVVATAEVDGIPTVFAAPARSEDGDVKLFVWKRLEAKHEAEPGNKWESRWLTLVNIIIICCCVGFVIQNAGFGVDLLRNMAKPMTETTVGLTVRSTVGSSVQTVFDPKEEVAAEASTVEGIAQSALEDL